MEADADIEEGMPMRMREYQWTSWERNPEGTTETGGKEGGRENVEMRRATASYQRGGLGSLWLPGSKTRDLWSNGAFGREAP